jgi:ribosomal protein S18 acetylase RimI-like enzyme
MLYDNGDTDLWRQIALARAGRDHAMAITYYKRFRMEIELEGPITTTSLPRGFVWVPWDESLLEQHAEVKYRSFIGEVDAYVFPCLGDRYGCRRLMCEIRRKAGFLPGATWLIACSQGYVGTVQGVMDQGPIGAIQNVGVVRTYRGLGLGSALVRRALAGFLQAGLRQAYLEVTAENSAAVQLYRNVGFRRAKTLYKAVDD